MPASLNEIVSPCLQRYSRIRYWTQDESRFGLKTIPRRRLTLKKIKPVVKVQWLFKAFYLDGVVEPLTGECIIQTYDRVNTENFQQFLNDFRNSTRSISPLFKPIGRASTVEMS